MGKMITKYTNKRHTCQLNKHIRHTKERHTITDTPSTIFTMISIDFIGAFMLASSFHYIQLPQYEFLEYITLENSIALFMVIKGCHLMSYQYHLLQEAKILPMKELGK